MRRFLLWLPVLVLGCSAPFRFKDPTVQAVSCGVTSVLLPEIEAIAAATGIPIAVVEAFYGDACSLAAARGLSQAEAEKEALAAAKHAARRMQSLHASFPAGTK